MPVKTAPSSTSFSGEGLFVVAPWEVESVWAVAWPLLGPAVAESGGRWDEAAVKARLLKGDQHLWTWWSSRGALACAVVSEVNRYPTGLQVCDLWFCGGHGLSEWCGPMLAAIEAWARRIGCHRIMVSGRVGWERVLPGFERTGIVLEKEL